jgi:hypothetical protein
MAIAAKSSPLYCVKVCEIACARLVAELTIKVNQLSISRLMVGSIRSKSSGVIR